MESYLEMHGHAIIGGFLVLPIQYWHCLIVFSDSDILNVDIEHAIPVFPNVGGVDRV
jgi:hypothetical protein